MITKEELKKVLADDTASIYTRLMAIRKLYPEEYGRFDLEFDINSCDKDGDTALMWASMYGHIEVVKLLLEAGADVNAKTIDGDTALKWASDYGHTEIVKLLLEAGADVNAKDKWGNTALVKAIDSGYIKIVKLLKQYGAKRR